MKNLLSIIVLSLFTGANAQVIIGGGSTGTAAVKTSVLLEFNSALNKGIIVPYLRTPIPAAAVANRGTILLDATNPNNVRMKYSNGSNWVDLSGQGSTLSPAFLATQPTSTVPAESATAKSIISDIANLDPTTVPDGVLVLESTTKAMVLPTVGTVTVAPGVLAPNIVSPSPGMMVYINTPGAKRLAVYNGSKWSFWKP